MSGSVVYANFDVKILKNLQASKKFRLFRFFDLKRQSIFNNMGTYGS